MNVTPTKNNYDGGKMDIVTGQQPKVVISTTYGNSNFGGPKKQSTVTGFSNKVTEELNKQFKKD